MLIRVHSLVAVAYNAKHSKINKIMSEANQVHKHRVGRYEKYNHLG